MERLEFTQRGGEEWKVKFKDGLEPTLLEQALEALSEYSISVYIDDSWAQNQIRTDQGNFITLKQGRNDKDTRVRLPKASVGDHKKSTAWEVDHDEGNVVFTREGQEKKLVVPIEKILGVSVFSDSEHFNPNDLLNNLES